MASISGGNELLNAKSILDRLQIPSEAKLADLGCGGAGHFVLPAAQRVGGDGLVYAVDVLKSVLRSVVSRARLLGIGHIKTIWSNLENVGATRIPAHSLDFAFLINTLYQATQHEKMIEEARRLLKPSGKLLVIDWLPGHSSLGPPAERRVAPERIEQMATQLGFKLIEKFQPGSRHFGLIFSQAG